tara:strand:+ start:1254 stop:1967 length:714 start_codon:yes stop_codon:yes gene_type:complete
MLFDDRTHEEVDLGLDCYSDCGHVLYPQNSPNATWAMPMMHNVPMLQRVARIPDGLKPGDLFELQTSPWNKDGPVAIVKVPDGHAGGERIEVCYRSYDKAWFAEVPCGLDVCQAQEVHRAHIHHRLQQMCDDVPEVAAAFDLGCDGGYENALCRYFGDVAPMDDSPNDMDDAIKFSCAFQQMCMKRFRVSREGDHMYAYNTFAMRRFAKAVDAGRVHIASASQQQEYDMAKKDISEI